MRTEIITTSNPSNTYTSDNCSKSVLPMPNDMILQSILIEESCIMSGYPVVIKLADYNLAQVGYSPNITFTDEVSTHVLLDNSPKPKLLKQLGWSSDSDDTYPLLATIPRYLSKGTSHTGIIEPPDYYELKINKYSLIELSYDYFDLGRVFQVTEVSGNMFNQVFYYLKIVPYHEEVDVDPTPINDPNLTHLIKEGDSLKHITLPGKRCPLGVPVNH